MSVGEICFSKSDVKLYMTVLIIIVGYFVYIYKCSRDTLANVDLVSHLTQKELQQQVILLQDELYKSKLAEQECHSQKAAIAQSCNSRSNVLDKIYNPLVSPERLYPGGRLDMSSYDNYQMIGFVYNGNDRYPLFGRTKYPGRTEKWEYYVIDESRNRLKIPFKSRNDNEINDGDTIDIDTLGNGYSAKIYEYDSIRYNPNI